MNQRTAPVFVKIDEYKEIIDVLDMVKSKVREMKSVLADINRLTDEENAEISMWNHTINEIERKIEGIDRMMFEPDQQW